MSLYKGVFVCKKDEFDLTTGCIWNIYTNFEATFWIGDYANDFHIIRIKDNMQAFHLEDLKRLALDMINRNFDIKGQDHAYYDDYFDDENFLDFMNNYGHAFLNLYNNANKDTDWVIFWDEDYTDYGREATREESDSVNKYVKSISKDTGINFCELLIKNTEPLEKLNKVPKAKKIGVLDPNRELDHYY